MIEVEQKGHSDNGGSDSLRSTPKSQRYTRKGDKGTSVLYTGEKRNKNDIAFEALGNIDELNSHIGLLRYFIFKRIKKLTPKPQYFGPGDKYEYKEPWGGCLKNYVEYNEIKKHMELLFKVQHHLIDMGASVATPYDDDEDEGGAYGNSDSKVGANTAKIKKTISKSTERKISRTRFPQDKIKSLEAIIDQLSYMLPNLTKFILPGGTKASCQAHICRTVCRRMERSIVNLHNSTIDGEIYHPVERTVLEYANRLSDYFFELARLLNSEISLRDDALPIVETTDVSYTEKSVTYQRK